MARGVGLQEGKWQSQSRGCQKSRGEKEIMENRRSWRIGDEGEKGDEGDQGEEGEMEMRGKRR